MKNLKFKAKLLLHDVLSNFLSLENMLFMKAYVFVYNLRQELYYERMRLNGKKPEPDAVSNSGGTSTDHYDHITIAGHDHELKNLAIDADEENNEGK